MLTPSEVESIIRINLSPEAKRHDGLRRYLQKAIVEKRLTVATLEVEQRQGLRMLDMLLSAYLLNTDTTTEQTWAHLSEFFLVIQDLTKTNAKGLNPHILFQAISVFATSGR